MSNRPPTAPLTSPQNPVGGVQNPAPSTVKNTAGGDALGKIGAPRRHNESA